MLKEIRRQLYLERKTFITWAVVALGTTLLVTAIIALVMSIVDEPEGVAVGNLVLLGVAAFNGMIITLSHVGVQLNMALKMGATRRNYLLAWLVQALLFAVVLGALGYLYLPLEKGIMTAVVGADAPVYAFALPLWALPAAALASTLLGFWMGALLMRYSRKGFWVAYGVVFGGFILFTQAMNWYTNERTDGVFGVAKQVGGLLLRLPGSILGLLALVIVLALAGHSWFLLHNVAAQD